MIVWGRKMLRRWLTFRSTAKAGWSAANAMSRIEMDGDASNSQAGVGGSGPFW